MYIYFCKNILVSLQADRQIYLKFPGKCPKLSINPYPPLGQTSSSHILEKIKRKQEEKFYFLLIKSKIGIIINKLQEDSL